MAFDPNNPTFYGACIAVYGAANMVGSPLRNTSGRYITYLYDDAEYETISEGQIFRVTMQAGDFRSPKPSQTDPLDFTWVIECDAGSDGVLRLRDGMDLNWVPATATTDNELGTFTVTGRSQVVVPTNVPTPADVVSGSSAPVIEVECTSGSVRVRQVRMRVWPTSGPSGAWVSQAGGTVRQGSYQIHQSGPGDATVSLNAPHTQGWNPDGSFTGAGPQVTINGGAEEGGFPGESDDGFIPMSSALSAATPPPYEYFRKAAPVSDWDHGLMNVGWNYYRKNHLEAGTHEWGGSLGCQMAVLVHTPTVISSVAGSWADPDRIYWETAAKVRGADGGIAYRAFERWSSGPQLDAGDSHVGVSTFALEQAPEVSYAEENFYPGIGFVTDYRTSTPIPTTSASPNTYGGAAAEITLPATPVVGIEAMATWFDNPPSGMDEFQWSSDGGGQINSTSATRHLTLTTVVVLERDPNYEYYDPAASGEVGGVGRFRCKDWDGGWRTIGPGKPADDFAIFKVKTPSGWYREARHGEDITGTGTHPVKVKVRDGTGPDVWDTVVWLTPLA